MLEELGATGGGLRDGHFENTDRGVGSDELIDAFKMEITKPDGTFPTLYVGLTMPSKIEAISPFIDRLMGLIERSHCVPGDPIDVKIALREALANAILHGNRQVVQKKVHISCRIRPWEQLSIVITDEGSGFDPEHVLDPTTPGSIFSCGGRGICLMKAFMDLVHFDLGGRRVRLQKSFKPDPPSCSRERFEIIPAADRRLGTGSKHDGTEARN